MSLKVAIIGEAYGAQEEKAQKPFIGAAGQELNRMLVEAGIVRAECLVTNVLNFRPTNNDMASVSCGKKDLPQGYTLPALSTGKYLKPEHLGEIARLKVELTEAKPNVAIALGNTACWALLSTCGISKIRGTVNESTLVPGLKTIPTYHPSAILRDWTLRAVSVLDLRKAAFESRFPEIKRPHRRMWLDPDLAGLEEFYRTYLVPAERIAFDIETSECEITCISFAPQPDLAIVVPFVDLRKPEMSYWPSLAEEQAAWRWVKKVLNLPQPKVVQNGLFDLQWLYRRYGIMARNMSQDTMLLHHALQPESPKSLDFMGSVYAQSGERPWKTLRPRGKTKDLSDDE